MTVPALPVLAAVHLAGAMDSLRLAEDALGVGLEALGALDEEPAGLDSDEVTGMREVVRLFVQLFAAVADGVRLPPGGSMVRRTIEELQEDGRNPAGLERAVLALEFATVEFAEVLDMIEAAGAGTAAATYQRALAGHQVFDMLSNRIGCALVGRRRPGADDDFSLN